MGDQLGSEPWFGVSRSSERVKMKVGHGLESDLSERQREKSLQPPSIQTSLVDRVRTDLKCVQGLTLNPSLEF